MGAARVETIALRYYGALAESQRASEILAASAAAGVLRPILVERRLHRERAPRSRASAGSRSSRRAARGRGISRASSRSSCTRATASAGWRARCSNRTARGSSRSAASASKRRLSGTMLIIANDDQPGVIGEVGTILGRLRREHRHLRARAQRRPARSASSTSTRMPARLVRWKKAVEAIRRVAAVRDVWLVAVCLDSRTRSGITESTRENDRGLDRGHEAGASGKRLAVHVKAIGALSMVADSIGRIDTPRKLATPPVKSRGTASSVLTRDTSSKTTRSRRPSSRRASGAITAPLPNCGELAIVTSKAVFEEICPVDACSGTLVTDQFARDDPHVTRQPRPPTFSRSKHPAHVRVKPDSRETEKQVAVDLSGVDAPRCCPDRLQDRLPRIARRHQALAPVRCRSRPGTIARAISRETSAEPISLMVPSTAPTHYEPASPLHGG